MKVRGFPTEYKTPTADPPPPPPRVLVAASFGWEVLEVISPQWHHQRHLLPTNDIRPHKLCEHCPCGPVEDYQAPDNWAHNSWDGRENLRYKH